MTNLFLLNYNANKIELKSRKLRGKDAYRIEAKLNTKEKNRSIIKHKNHCRKRETVCGLKYDNITMLWRFIEENAVGHWNKVTCKKCLKFRKRYEEELNGEKPK